MIELQESLPRLANFEDAIRHQIVQRKGVRLGNLEIEATADRVIVRGAAASFHLKQLMIQGVLDVIGRHGTIRLEIDVEVAPVPPGLDFKAL
jgi:hypothetical protein